MTWLESLDLSKNHLLGHIPTSLSSLSFLSHLNLSYNNLSGQIPIGTQLQSMDASSFVGNKLCGPPLKKCIEDHDTTHSNGSKEDGEREDDEYWFRLGIAMGFGVSFLGVIVPLLCPPAFSFQSCFETSQHIHGIPSRNVSTEKHKEAKRSKNQEALICTNSTTNHNKLI
ncbi:hypothetical protein F8388_024562 [Cannabis sativa]|uniref:Uncharacterized protein n=1 Tax=Cannabis sativa TaxID=3483 RepID=A0A7J6GDL6_CANSA|nr:hypothetical protein F8388_024562 [Cannabis sativa]KAF4398974.1 hypothetical protein G4B88_023568 [Cannabis sativa]